MLNFTFGLVEIAALGRDLAQDGVARHERDLLHRTLLRRHGDAAQLVGVVVAAELEKRTRTEARHVVHAEALEKGRGLAAFDSFVSHSIQRCLFNRGAESMYL